MAYPTDYTRAYSFLGFAQGQGNFEFPGTPMDTELDNVGLTVDQINAFLVRSFTPEGIVKPGKTADTQDFEVAILEAQAQATASAASAAAAASFSGSAQTAASAAATSQSAATNSATSASTSATAANTSKLAAAASATAAAGSATAAATSASAAATSAALFPAFVATQYLRANAAGNAWETRTAAQTRTDLGLAIGADVQAFDTDLAAIAALTSAANLMPYATGAGTWATTAIGSFGRSLVAVANATAARTTLGVVTGTDVQAFDADLSAIAALTSAADVMPYATGAQAWATTPLTAAARTVLDDTTTSAMRTTLGLAIGTDVQAFDADLSAIAALTSAADVMPYATGAQTWATTPLTAAARTVLDDTTTAAMLTTLGALPKAGGDMTGALTFSTGQNLIHGSTASIATVYAGGAITPGVQVKGGVGLMLARFGATASPPILNFSKSRGAVDTHTTINSGDQLMAINTAASDGTAFRDGARMVITSTAVPTATLTPSRFDFAVNDGTTTIAQALGIDPTGNIQVGGQAAANNVITPARHFQLRSYTVAGLPAATTAGQEIYVSDGAGGFRHAVSDGSKWVLESGQDASVAAINSQSGTTYTLVLADAYRTVEMSNALGNTLTVPTNASVAFPIGTTISLAQMGVGQTTIAAAGGVTIRSLLGNLKVVGQYGVAVLVKRATDEWVLSGNLSP